jgi:pimeloyl-ACP methyl ester carboxylesterase
MNRVTLLLAATALMGLAAPASAQRRAPRTPDAPLRGVDGDLLGTQHTFVSSVGGQIAPPLGGWPYALPIGNRVYRVGLGATGTAWRERMVVGLPDQIPGPLPVLVLFHAYGEEPEHTVANTDYMEAARKRGWLVVAPLGAHKYNFGIDYAQENTQAALEFLAQYFPLDLDRVYGVGFSMGGGWMASFAARHTGEDHLRFAALVNHTGSTSVSHVHASAVNTTLLQSPLMFGGSPAAQSFRYSTASAMDLIAATGEVDQDTDLLRNIAHVPVRTWTCLADPLAYLVQQSEEFDAQRVVRGGTSDYTAGFSATPGLQHSWRTLDEDAVLDWLETHTLTLPNGSTLTKVLADRDARFQHFAVTQRTAGSFTPFDWAVAPAVNRAYVIRASNLGDLRFDPQDLGLDPASAGGLELVFNEKDGLPATVTLEDMDPPTTIHLNGVATTGWSYDAAARTLTLDYAPTGMSAISWRVLP